ncbi:hypothetical protein CVT24_008853 [Panaeolus cyanescens]|uniref:Uncharacterized protein n=1 Tax=Panaeolus cyanescens TaxID=181874 RepID=A0A409VEA8_9AGAR|nr:hypothetical protein CVT24_008853 [Panaeolus cyanescens]
MRFGWGMTLLKYFYPALTVPKLQDRDVCLGAVRQQAPIIAHDLRSITIPGQTSTKLCHALLGVCEEPNVNPVTMSFPRAAPLIPKVWESKGKTPFQVVHLSDVHIDRHYEVGADAICTKPICCRRYADDKSSVERPAGPHGMTHCDTPTALLRQLLANANSINSKFNIFTGDVADGAVWLYNQNENTASLQHFNDELRSGLASRTFPSFGNHETAPANAFPRNTTTRANVQWDWLDDTATSQVKHNSGSYSMVVPETSLRILSLNTNYWFKGNFWLYDSNNQQADPNGVLAFAIKELQAAEDAQQRVWIIAHMPPSNGDAMKDQPNYFDQIVQRYKNTIAGQFYGHTHIDEFVVSYSDWNNRNANTAISVHHIAPAITPRGANPAFRVYDVDPDTYEIMDTKTIMAETSSPSFQTSPQWITQYSARQFYSAAVGEWPANKPLNPEFWHRVTEAFEADNDLFLQFVVFKDRGGKLQNCDAACKQRTICNLRAGRKENGCVGFFSLSFGSGPRLPFRKRDAYGSDDLEAHSHAHHCEGVGLSSILSGLMTELQSPDGELLQQELKIACVSSSHFYTLILNRNNSSSTSDCLIFDGGNVTSYLKTVKTWLDANPNEVITFIFTNPENASLLDFWKPAFDDSGISPLAYAPLAPPVKQSDWPTLGELIDSGKRVIVFMDAGANTAVVPFILPEFQMIWETPFSVTDPTFPCRVDRIHGPLPVEDHTYMINHSLNVNILPSGGDVIIPDRMNAQRTNGMASILSHIGNCAPLGANRNPQFILMDWVHIGDGFRVADMLNGLPSPPPHSPSNSTLGQVSGSFQSARLPPTWISVVVLILGVLGADAVRFALSMMFFYQGVHGYSHFTSYPHTLWLR